MKHRGFRLLAWFLALSVLLSLLPTAALAQDGSPPEEPTAAVNETEPTEPAPTTEAPSKPENPESPNQPDTDETIAPAEANGESDPDGLNEEPPGGEHDEVKAPPEKPDGRNIA